MAATGAEGTFVVARVERVDGIPRLAVVALAAMVGDRLVPQPSSILPGVTREGRHVLTIPGTDRDDALLEWKVSARIRLYENDLGRRTEYVVRYGQSRRDSNIDAYDRSRTILNFGVNLGF